MRIVKTSISLEESLLDDVDELAEDCGTSRSEVIESILDHVMSDEALVDEIFPREEEAEEESE